MKLLFSGLLLACCFLGTAQQVNLENCNLASNLAARSSCLKGSVESLLYQELLKVADSTRNTQTLGLDLFVDGIGNIYVDSVIPSEKKPLVEKVIQGIKPLSSYKNYKGELLQDAIRIDLEVFPPKKSISVSEEDAEIANMLKGNSKKDTLSQDSPKEKKDYVPFAVIENVPVYPGCYQGTNEELKSCMGLNIQRHVVNNFNMALANSLNLPDGTQRISVQFKIDRFGFVTNIRARASRPELEKEAVRVVGTLPRMMPGKQFGKEVGVLYALPILFKVEGNPKKTPRKKKRIRRG